MKCTICGAENLEGAAYCEDCGSKLPTAVVQETPVERDEAEPSQPAPAEITSGETVICSACGAENPPGSKFCDECGASITAGVQSSPHSEAEEVSGARLIVEGVNVVFPLNKDVITLGRQSPADGIFPDIDLTEVDDDAYVSRRHARILRKDGGFIFEDLGSSNGSFINNARVLQGVQHVLNEGDVVRLGKTVMNIIFE